MTVDITTSQGRLPTIGLPGGQADQTPCMLDTLINESTTGGLTVEGSAGGIDFGVAVAKGSADNGCKIVDSNNDRIVGITSRRATVPATSSTSPVIGWKSGQALSVYKFGCVFAVPCEDVDEGDQVLAIVASSGQLGGASSGVAGTGRLAVAGARWKTTTASGAVGIVEVIGREAAVLTS